MGKYDVSVVRCYHQAQHSLAKPPIRPDRAAPDVNPTLAIARTPGLLLLTCPGQVEIGR